MSDTRKVPHIEHDDLCVWWDNVGVEPLNYTCSCGMWAEYVAQQAETIARLREALDRIMVTTVGMGGRSAQVYEIAAIAYASALETKEL